MHYIAPCSNHRFQEGKLDSGVKTMDYKAGTGHFEMNLVYRDLLSLSPPFFRASEGLVVLLASL